MYAQIYKTMFLKMYLFTLPETGSYVVKERC